jgi:signal transduction histidine kinase
VVQEAIHNSSRHARARSVDVEVRREQHRVRFTVRDDGSGFDPRSVRGLGILGMEERVRRLGGSIEIDSSPGGGTTIRAELPLNESATTSHGHDSAHSHIAG